MENDKERKLTTQKSAVQFIRKNGLTILLGLVLGVMIINPDAKSWVLKQLLATGIFNAHMDSKSPEKTIVSTADFNFTDENGNTANIASLRGKVVFINFWASWCPPCRAEFPSIISLHEQFKANPDVYFLMINEDENVSAANAFLKKEHAEFPLFKISGAMPATIYSGTLPTTVILDKQGRIRYKHEGIANYGSERFVKQIEKLAIE